MAEDQLKVRHHVPLACLHSLAQQETPSVNALLLLNRLWLEFLTSETEQFRFIPIIVLTASRPSYLIWTKKYLC